MHISRRTAMKIYVNTMPAPSNSGLHVCGLPLTERWSDRSLLTNPASLGIAAGADRPLAVVFSATISSATVKAFSCIVDCRSSWKFSGWLGRATSASTAGATSCTASSRRTGASARRWLSQGSRPARSANINPAGRTTMDWYLLTGYFNWNYWSFSTNHRRFDQTGVPQR